LKPSSTCWHLYRYSRYTGIFQTVIPACKPGTSSMLENVTIGARKMSVKRWETRPLEVWNKAKEMRKKWEQSVRDAEEEKVLLAQGNAGWVMGFPALRCIEDNPLGAMMAYQSDKFSRECRAASEIRGWGREICGYQLNCWGAMYLDRQIDGSKFPMRDMVIPFPDPCDQHTKRGQAPMDYSNIPRWQGDSPLYTGPDDPERDKAMIENKVGCVLDQIKDIERIFGQKFDDEKLIEVVKLSARIRPFAGEVCSLMRNIPTPLGQKDLYSFYTLGGLTKTDPEETVDLWKTLRDEVKWRADNQIAAVATERYRWIEAHPPPWHFLRYYRYMEKYGAVCIGSQYSHMMGGPYEFKADGTWAPRTQAPLAGDMVLKTREDAVRAMVGGLARGHNFKVDEVIRTDAICEMAKAFKVDGAIMPLWRGGVGCTIARKEQGRLLSEMGVRVMHYEGSQPGDRTDLDENRLLDQLDTWMESQGLRKLED
jgi:benzoyl-CoA reductase/2-hydroxyglutaryl-CoA dehydratase subunit BcrC/BadD/HgdB